MYLIRMCINHDIYGEEENNDDDKSCVIDYQSIFRNEFIESFAIELANNYGFVNCSLTCCELKLHNNRMTTRKRKIKNSFEMKKITNRVSYLIIGQDK
jgi:hypothetical protein